MTIGAQPARPAVGRPVPQAGHHHLATADRWQPPLDYYVVVGPGPGRRTVEAIVVEDFVRAADGTTVGLRSAGWTPSEARWWSSAAYSRAMRSDPELRGRLVPVDRDGADAVHRRIGGGPLPGEPMLRTRFHDDQAFPTTTPLLFGSAAAPDGCRERRVYRVLFAGDLPAERLAGLTARWQPAGGQHAADGSPTARRRVGADRYEWTVRRVGRGLAWSLDLTALLATDADHSVGPLLHELTSVVRLCGLVPVTTERFA
ncbi:hypothetical protein [Micromonospora sp. WMMD812]|uniref:hypothetical protein n=1 Tax=Micromonospora sp. WMMD812 TaxID=3015152 RepID=UPI00248D2A87|nr:hypothetical protein [Micromonospora sp. WMMD812]WBB69978.1 hypothetical protein O7603_11715 [Micromonospora sp. WMMD812]